MKIYVSEKDFDTYNEKIVTFNDVDLAVYDEKCDAYDIVETIERGTIIQSLEKHEAEVRKQVYDEVLYELQDIYDNLAEDSEDWYVADKITNLMQKLAECKDKEITVIMNGNVGIDVAIQGALTCKDIQGNVDCQGNIKVVK